MACISFQRLMARGDEQHRFILGGASGTSTSRQLGGLSLLIEWLGQDPLPNLSQLIRGLGILE
ncbi:MAG TPA: hypothetical protein VKX96_14975 [Chloroflexota bacterium]|nr:hypothetical protein [Chloroflexota bacterium]